VPFALVSQQGVGLSTFAIWGAHFHLDLGGPLTVFFGSDWHYLTFSDAIHSKPECSRLAAGHVPIGSVWIVLLVYGVPLGNRRLVAHPASIARRLRRKLLTPRFWRSKRADRNPACPLPVPHWQGCTSPHFLKTLLFFFLLSPFRVPVFSFGGGFSQEARGWPCLNSSPASPFGGGIGLLEVKQWELQRWTIGLQTLLAR